MTTVTRLPVDDAFVAFLRAGIATHMCYYADSNDPASGVPPADAPLPYAVLYGISGGEYYGPPLTGPDADPEFIYQVTCVGRDARQALWLADKVTDLVVGRTATGAFTHDLTVSGMVVADRRTNGGTPAAEPTGALWQATPRYEICMTS